MVRAVLRCLLGMFALSLLPPAFTVAQVLFVGCFHPIGTPTMVTRSVDALRAGEGLRWPRREVRSLQALGANVPRAVLSAEDARFFLHDGFDWESLCDAVGKAKGGKRLRGASTVSQQTAKNLFLWQGRSYVRKGFEVWYTFLLELLLPKTRILELYLNIAETGPMVFGAEAGAQHHFGKGAAKLGLDEAGRLAGILPDPRKRGVTGTAARDRARFVAANPVPFPSDPGFDRLAADYYRARNGPLSCFVR